MLTSLGCVLLGVVSLYLLCIANPQNPTLAAGAALLSAVIGFVVGFKSCYTCCVKAVYDLLGETTRRYGEEAKSEALDNIEKLQ